MTFRYIRSWCGEGNANAPYIEGACIGSTTATETEQKEAAAVVSACSKDSSLLVHCSCNRVLLLWKERYSRNRLGDAYSVEVITMQIKERPDNANLQCTDTVKNRIIECFDGVPADDLLITHSGDRGYVMVKYVGTNTAGAFNATANELMPLYWRNDLAHSDCLLLGYQWIQQELANE